MDEEHRKKYEEDLKQQQQKHNKHAPIHHPGNKAQLEEGKANAKDEFVFSRALSTDIPNMCLCVAYACP